MNIKEMKKYQIILADPPWSYRAKNPICKLEKQPKTCSVEYYYPTMKLEDIFSLPVNKIADDNCVLFLWATTPMLIEALATMKAWGFKYKTMITWHKPNKDCMGYWFRVCTEHLLVGVTGNVKAFRSMSRTLYECQRGGHSQKPYYFITLINELFPTENKIELFSRDRGNKDNLTQERKKWNWDVWGNEVESDIDLSPTSKNY